MLSNSTIYRLAVALAIGLLLGLERGWSTRNLEEGNRIAGFRTFGLIGLTGGVCAMAPGVTLLATGFGVLGLALVAFYSFEMRKDQDVGATTFMAALLTYGLGGLAVRGEPLTAAAAATAASVLLAAKSPLHAWIKAVTWLELRAFLVLLAMTILVLPLMPNHAVDPWGALVPFDIWLLAIVIACLSFVGYGAVRLLGPRSGIVVSALAGGLVSSTAMGVLFARSAHQDGGRARLMSGAALLSSGVMAIRTLALVGFVRVELLYFLAPSLLAMAAVLFGAGGWLIRLSPSGDAAAGPSVAAMKEAAPFDLFLILRLAGFIAGVMLAARLARQAFGQEGVMIVSFLAGLGDVDAVTLSLAHGPANPVDLVSTSLAIAVAVAANTLMKSILSLVIGGRSHGVWVLAGGAASIIAAAFSLFAALA